MDTFLSLLNVVRNVQLKDDEIIFDSINFSNATGIWSIKIPLNNRYILLSGCMKTCFSTSIFAYGNLYENNQLVETIQCSTVPELVKWIQNFYRST